MTLENRFLEDICAEKSHLGAELEFEPKTLIVKKNEHGFDGVFVTRDLPINTVVLSVPRYGGSLTALRAYEEAKELLRPLELERFYLDENFILAAALYLRWTNSETRATDILVSSEDLKAEYANTPLSCYGSIELLELEGINDKNSRYHYQQAKQLNDMIANLSVDEQLFRMLYAYAETRSWSRFGIIPILDWINAASGKSANVTFSYINADNIGFTLQRNVSAGEELVWDFNNSNAIETWFRYGYADRSRPAAARLRVELTESELNRLTRLTIEKLNLPKSSVVAPGMLDPHLWLLDLKCPTKGSTSSAPVQTSLVGCCRSFAELRAQFRMLLLVGESDDLPNIDLRDLTSDHFKWGLEFEQRTISAMRTALANGLTDLNDRVTKFRASRFGNDVDLTPLIQMREYSAEIWEEILEKLDYFYQSSSAKAERVMPTIISGLMNKAPKK